MSKCSLSREECLQQCDNNRDKLNEKMLSAAESGDNPGMEAALEDGAEITSTDEDGDTGLHLSVQAGHQSVVLTLLTRGLDPNIRAGAGRSRMTALMWAAGRGHLTCAQTLIQHGALTDLQDVGGYTALMRAAKYNYPDIAGELLARQADVNIVNENGKTALQLAEEKNNQDVVRILKAADKKNTLNKEV